MVPLADVRREGLAVEERTDVAQLRCCGAGGLGFIELHMRRGQNGVWRRILLELPGEAIEKCYHVGLPALQVVGLGKIDEPPGKRLLILIATSLERLVLRSRPFWGTSGRPIRHMRIGFAPKRLIRLAPRILYGNDGRRLPENDYRSGGAARLELWLDAPFTIDGELFTPAPTRPVRINADETVRFVRL